MYLLLLHQRNGAHLAPLSGAPAGDKDTALQSIGAAVRGLSGYQGCHPVRALDVTATALACRHSGNYMKYMENQLAVVFTCKDLINVLKINKTKPSTVCPCQEHV